MRRNIAMVVGSALLVLAVVLFGTLNSSPEFGWFAYTPLSSNDIDYTSDAVLLSRGRFVACLVGVLGLLVLAGGRGYRAGQRRGSGTSPGSADREASPPA